MTAKTVRCVNTAKYNIAAFDQLAFITRYRHLTYRDFCHLHACCTSPTVIFGPLHGCHPKSISALSQRLQRRMDIPPRWGSECYGRLESILLVIVWFMAKRNVTVWGYVWCQPIHDACGASWRRLRRWPGVRERERERELDVIGVTTRAPKRGKISRTVDQPIDLKIWRLVTFVVYLFIMPPLIDRITRLARPSLCLPVCPVRAPNWKTKRRR